MKALTWEAWNEAIQKQSVPAIPPNCFTVPELATKWGLKSLCHARRRIRRLLASGWLELVRLPGVKPHYYRLVAHD